MKNTGDGRRIQRVEREVQEQVAQYVIAYMRGELPGLVTIARVRMPGDLRTAKVYVSVLGTDNEKEKVLELLKGRAGEIQRYIGDQLRMRFCPKLTFFSDDTTDRVIKIDRILKEIEGEKKATAEESEAEEN